VLDLLLLVAFSGGVVYLVMYLLARRQIGGLKQAQKDHARFRALTELTADWFWETGADHRIRWLSGGGPIATWVRPGPAHPSPAAAAHTVPASQRTAARPAGWIPLAWPTRIGERNEAEGREPAGSAGGVERRTSRGIARSPSGRTLPA